MGNIIRCQFVVLDLNNKRSFKTTHIETKWKWTSSEKELTLITRCKESNETLIWNLERQQVIYGEEDGCIHFIRNNITLQGSPNESRILFDKIKTIACDHLCYSIGYPRHNINYLSLTVGLDSVYCAVFG
eukprot:304621_1